MKAPGARGSTLLELVLGGALIVGLLVVAISASTRQQREQEARGVFTPYSVRSAADSGLYGLEAWLKELGFTTTRLEGARFTPDDGIGVLFVMPPSVGYSDADANRIATWVEDGGTLIYAYSDGAPKLNVKLGVRAAEMPFAPFANAALPVNAVTFTESIRVEARKRLIVESGAFDGEPATVHLRAGDNDGAVLVSFQRDLGTVYVTTAPYLFSNESLRGAGASARLVRVMMDTDAPATVAFDEYHLGFDSADAVSGAFSLATLYDTPWGWALIYLTLLSLIALVLNGRRFGRTAPLASAIARRSPSEYVVSMARLFQRGGKRAAMLKHYRQRLKHALGAPAGVDAALPDDEFVEALARARDDLNSARLIDTLRDMGRSDIDEATLLRLARAATQIDTFKTNSVEAR